MAPHPKRKASDDDFVYTLSDNDEELLEVELLEDAPPKKRAKKSKGESRDGGVDDAMDPDFELLIDGTGDGLTEDLEGWDFGGTIEATNGVGRSKVDSLGGIIEKRRERKGDAYGDGAAEQEVGPQEDEVSEMVDVEIDLDDDADGVLAVDAFGMGMRSETGDSDAESVATPVDHPDDLESSDDGEEEEDEGDAQSDEEAAAAVNEEAERSFFAPAEKQSMSKETGPASFMKLSLSRPVLRGLSALGFSKPTPIQAKTIPIALMGKDVVGGAVTGSGKTAAFVVPILERLIYRPNRIPTTRVVILAPTRELASQCHSVTEKLASYTDIKTTLTVGGLSVKAQETELKLRPDIVVATPGRFIDHMRNSPSFAVDTVEILVLDEADRMLEDGFADELNEILATLPKSRQTMLFSATMTSSVDRLIRAGLQKPVRIMVDAQQQTVGTLVQEFVRIRPGREEKRMGYLVHICKNLYTSGVLIFFRQKKAAHIARIVFGLLGLSCAELHGSMNQTQRIASMEAFRDRKVSILLATDVASRGLDVKAIDTVINYEAPQNLEIYIHRVGRTARAGRTGVAITLAAEVDRKVVKAAVKAAKKQGAKIVSRTIEPGEADKWQAEIDGMQRDIEEIMAEEKQEKQLAQVEMQVKKGENMIRYEDEIKGKPKRTWFETERDKKKARDLGREELNGFREKLKKKHDGKLSNKDRKKLDMKAERNAGRFGSKGMTKDLAKGKAKGKPTHSPRAGGRGKKFGRKPA